LYFENLFKLICFSSIVKQAMFAYVNHARIYSLNQPVLTNEDKQVWSRNQWELAFTVAQAGAHQ